MFTHLIQNLPWPAKRDTRSTIGPCPGASTSLAIAELSAQHDLLVVITPNTSTAHTLERELPLFLENPIEVLTLPDWETLPYDNFSPHQDIISERLYAFHRLPEMSRGILLTPITTLMHRTPPVHYLAGNSLILELGQKLDTKTFVHTLSFNGYHAVDTVREHGEYAIRGSLFDIYPMGSSTPYRIDLFDAEIESLRTFNPETQLTIDKIDSIRLLPAREFPLTNAAIEQFQINWYRSFDGDPNNCPSFTEISNGRVPGGTEYYLPLFFETCGKIFDYLHDNAAIIAIGDHYQAAQRFWEEIDTRFQEYGIDPRRPLLPPARGFVPVEELYADLKRYSILELNTNFDTQVHNSTNFQHPPNLQETVAGNTAMERLEHFLRDHKAPVLLAAETTGRREILLESLAQHNLKPEPVKSWTNFIQHEIAFAITVAPVDRGIYLGPNNPTLVVENQLFGERVAQHRRRKTIEESNAEAVIRDLTELQTGVPVVHLQHGIGRYLGLQILQIDGGDAEFLVLEYSANDKLYVPVGSLHLISRYTGANPNSAPLHKLGSEQWEKSRRKASQRASDVAAKLLEVYARREARQGFQCKLELDAWERFGEGFPFEETPDQAAAIDAVREDMCSPRIMDRLICGDVGFGKTEVAMRASFITVHNKKQVAILVPTTLLAQQHYNSFRDRFADWPVTIDVISRFKSNKDLKKICAQVASGKVDILVGTHKLLQSDFKFEDLGLLIIDEEHRFGVKQKEAIKALRAEVDILTMTATPIPRTLNMALGGLRDLSIIVTPPAKRLSIKTFIREHSIALIKEAILRETLRGGQIYYLHNEVKSINETSRKLGELLPDLSIGIAHGQLREMELERVMSDFYHQRYHILVCSTIIETGIDVPNANTIIIDRADKFGLAQLHQLRGRVGRSHHQAYAYLLSPPRSVLNPDAEKRLDAIEAAGELGAGYQLATHDLEIRGAGELLGDEQSGQIHSVGFNLYLDMLHNAVAALRRGEIPNVDAPLDSGTEIKLHVPALIPEDYLPNITTRLVLYKRIAAANSQEDLREIQVEMIDRFGLLPDPVKNLFVQAEIRVNAKHLGISEVEATTTGGSIEFSNDTRVNPLTLVKLVQSDPQRYSLAGSSKLKFQHPLPDLATRKAFVEQLLKRFNIEAEAN